MCHKPDAEGVPGVEPLLLDEEVHGFGQTLVVAHPERLHAACLRQARLYLVRQLAALLLGAGMTLEMADVLDGHLNDLGLLNPTAAFLEIGGWN